MKNNTVAEIKTTVTASRHSSMALLAREAVKKRLANMADGTIMIRPARRVVCRCRQPH